MQNITGTLMSEDRVIAHIKNGVITDAYDILLPLYLKRTKDVEKWLAYRAVDHSRKNARPAQKSLAAAHNGRCADCACSKRGYGDRLAIGSDPKAQRLCMRIYGLRKTIFPSLPCAAIPTAFQTVRHGRRSLPTPAASKSAGSSLDGEWWMYKNGNSEGILLGAVHMQARRKSCGLPMAHYELDGEYIRSKDFTNGAEVNFEPMRALADDDEDYENCFNILNEISPDIAVQYLLLLWMDTVC